MTKTIVKLIIGTALLLIILMVVMEMFYTSQRPAIVRTVENYERALCEFRKEDALACCTEDGLLIRNGREIPFSSPEFYQAVGKHEHDIQTEIQFDNFDIENDEAEVDVVFISPSSVSKKRRSPVSCRITLKRVDQTWKIAKIEEK